LNRFSEGVYGEREVVVEVIEELVEGIDFDFDDALATGDEFGVRHGC
jgi:hypothetical protein